MATVHVLKVTLRDVRPAVWRRLEVPSAMSLGTLHDVLQLAFDWRDDHLHDFVARGVRYTPRSDLYESSWRRQSNADEGAATLEQVAPRVGDTIEYTYDFGDDWRHRIEVESVRPPAPAETAARRARCTGGGGRAPEEDLGTVRPGRFDEAERAGLDAQLRSLGEISGVESGTDDSTDPVLAGVLPDLDGQAQCPCGCGELTDPPGGGLPAFRPPPLAELAALAEQTVLVRRCVALATWLGTGRSLTPSRLLKPADALRAEAELGLATPIRPNSTPPAEDVVAGADERETPAGKPGDRFDSDGEAAVDLFEAAGLSLTSDSVTSGPGGGAQLGRSARRIRSARDLGSLHPLWTACLDARLIDVRGGKAYPGPGLAVWDGPALPAARVEAWATLLAGQLRARVDAYAGDRGLFGPLLGQVLQASASLLYATAGAPAPLTALAMALAELGEDGGEEADLVGIGQILMLPQLIAAIAAAAEDWLVAGALSTVQLPKEEADALAAEIDDLRPLLAGHHTAVGETPDGLNVEDATSQLLDGVLDAVVNGPAVALTPLGHYGLGRLLRAHGWSIPLAGACRGLSPGELLDALQDYTAVDIVAETVDWLAARGDAWEEALRAVIWSAAIKGDDGPVRRAALQVVLGAAGPRVSPLLDAAQADPWLGAVVAAAREDLRLGPEPSLAHRLWLAVDELSLSLAAAKDREDADESLDASGLVDRLLEPGGVAAAVAVRHPAAPEVLHGAALLLDDPALRRTLTKALKPVRGRPGGRAENRRSQPGGGRRRTTRR